MSDTDMCPNCITPWKCNGPYLDGYDNHGRSAGVAPDIFQQCSVCGSADRVTLVPDWREPSRAIPIVGCGNPWHYTNVADRSAGAAPLDAQTRDLLEACYERNIHSRGDMEYAFQPWALDVGRLSEAILRHDADDSWPSGSKVAHDRGKCWNGRCAEAIAAEYARLSEGTDR